MGKSICSVLACPIAFSHDLLIIFLVKLVIVVFALKRYFEPTEHAYLMIMISS